MNKGSRYVRELLKIDKLVPKKIEKENAFDIERCERNMQLLNKWREMYDSLIDFRLERKRCYDFLNGDQWNDYMVDPDDPCGKLVREKDYMMREGKMPMVNNLILKQKNMLTGLRRASRRDPVAVARDSAESKLGDMMSNMLQYAYHINDIHEVDMQAFIEALASGMALDCVRYLWDSERGAFDVHVANERPDLVFFDGDLDDVRMKNITTIGFLRSYSETQLVSTFATNEEEEERIRNIYRSHAYDEGQIIDATHEDRRENEDFYIAYRRDRMRVIEGWTLESKKRLRCWDRLVGEQYVAELSAKPYIDEINTQRATEMILNGGRAEDTATITYELFYDTFWVLRYLTPWGHELLALETPFDHLSHPYTMRLYRFQDGKIRSFISNLIPQQKCINRYVAMMDFIRGASAKGVLMVDAKQVPKGVSKKEFARAWTKTNSVMFLDMLPGSTPPQQFNGSAVNAGDIEMINLQMRLLEEISGIHSALAGKQASQGTPSSLYAQEAQNASTNVQDLMDWFDSFVRARDYKMMSVIAQYYVDSRYINISGNDYSEEAKWWTPDRIRNCKFDLAITGTMNTPSYNMIMNDMLQQLVMGGLIDMETFLRASNLPFRDKMLQLIAETKQKAQANPTQPIDVTPITQSQVGDEIRAQSNATAQEMIDKALAA